MRGKADTLLPSAITYPRSIRILPPEATDDPNSAPEGASGDEVMPRQRAGESHSLVGDPATGGSLPGNQATVEGSGTERHATWLELFFDLVFVVAVSELAGRLDRDLSPTGVLQFSMLFIPVWWAWTGSTFYADRFETSDPIHRVLTGLQMLGIAILAVNVHKGLDQASAGFAVSYAAVRSILALQYMRGGRRFPPAYPLSRRYARGFGLAAGIWLASALVPPPARFVVWLGALVVDFGTPLSSRHLQARFPIDTSHLPERFGLFTLIVLGESILAVVNGVADQELGLASGATASLGLAIAFSLWWIYFDNIDNSVVTRTRVAGQLWVYTHLPLVMGLTAAGVGVERAVANPSHLPLSGPDRWVLGGALAVCLLTIAIIDMTAMSSIQAMRHETPAGSRLIAAGAALVVTGVGRSLLPLGFVGLMAALCAVQVAAEIRRTRSGRRASAAASFSLHNMSLGSNGVEVRGRPFDEPS